MAKYGGEAHPLAQLTKPDGTLSISCCVYLETGTGKNGRDLHQNKIKNKTHWKLFFLDKSLRCVLILLSDTEYAHQQVRVQVPYSRYEADG
jgi:hypothetical protein